MHIFSNIHSKELKNPPFHFFIPIPSFEREIVKVVSVSAREHDGPPLIEQAFSLRNAACVRHFRMAGCIEMQRRRDASRRRLQDKSHVHS